MAVPTKLGQSFNAKPSGIPKRLSWKAFNEDGSIWFEDNFDIYDRKWTGQNTALSARLSGLLNAVTNVSLEINELLLQGWNIETRLDFNRNWGLGSSSTLVHNLARWLNINPYELLEKTFGGSGYDLACAGMKSPILYNLNGSEQKIMTTSLDDKVTKQILFVYLNKKQNSREGIERFRKLNINKSVIDEISLISLKMQKATSVIEFCAQMDMSEKIVSKYLNLEMVKTQYFSDFYGSTKSLGAWGGDFIMAISEEPIDVMKNYFKQRGFKDMFTYNEIIV